ncbi:MAG: hypothetical protein SGBAC_012850 [Bacillariaceae sp.]
MGNYPPGPRLQNDPPGSLLRLSSTGMAAQDNDIKRESSRPNSSSSGSSNRSRSSPQPCRSQLSRNISHGAEAQSPTYNRLGKPIPGVPGVARRQIENPGEEKALSTQDSPSSNRLQKPDAVEGQQSNLTNRLGEPISEARRSPISDRAKRSLRRSSWTSDRAKRSLRRNSRTSDRAKRNLRRSSREAKPRRFLLKQTLVDRNRFIEYQFDYQCGLEQPGSSVFKGEKEIARKEDQRKGNVIFNDYLKPAGWTWTKSSELESNFVFLAKGVSAKTAIDDVSKFYSYESIWRKWDSDDAFKNRYFREEDQGTEPEDTFDAARNSNSLLQNVTDAVSSQGSSRIGEPTPEVPVVASRAVEETEETVETEKLETQDSTATNRCEKSDFAEKQLSNLGNSLGEHAPAVQRPPSNTVTPHLRRSSRKQKPTSNTLTPNLHRTSRKQKPARFLLEQCDEAICRKWDADEGFKNSIYLGEESEEEMAVTFDINTTVKNGSDKAPACCNRLGEPTPGVPVPARRPVETTEETEPMDLQDVFPEILNAKENDDPGSQNGMAAAAAAAAAAEEPHMNLSCRLGKPTQGVPCAARRPLGLAQEAAEDDDEYSTPKRRLIQEPTSATWSNRHLNKRFKQTRVTPRSNSISRFPLRPREECDKDLPAAAYKKLWQDAQIEIEKLRSKLSADTQGIKIENLQDQCGALIRGKAREKVRHQQEVRKLQAKLE